MPMLRLASLLVDTLFQDASLDYADLLIAALSRFMDMLNNNKMADDPAVADQAEMGRFLRNCLDMTLDSDPAKRKHILRVRILNKLMNSTPIRTVKLPIYCQFMKNSLA